MMMFENVGNISSLIIIGAGIIVLSLVRYKITRNKAEGFLLSGVGLVFLGYSFIVHYIMMDYINVEFLFLGVLDIFFAVLFGLKGMYELGTGKPRTFLLANQKFNVVGSVVFKVYKHVECHYFRATLGDDETINLYVIPITYAIPISEEENKFSKVPKENSPFKTDSKGKITKDEIK
ncbi:hypothetical protein KAI56_03185 [Candidatus Parcubacteria bacterium]|nr:hypothetical protein [Candidatus Parcubacteria bacterium]